jgi:hypothetical protein
MSLALRTRARATLCKMRFRGKLIETEPLCKMAKLLSKIRKTCIVHITPRDFKFIISGETDNVTVWSGIELVRRVCGLARVTHCAARAEMLV